MANIPEKPNPQWPEVYQIETTDRVLGGAGGVANRQAVQLSERTENLKKQITDIAAGKTTVGVAKKWDSSRTITVTGDAACVITIDGSRDISTALSLRKLTESDIPNLAWNKIANTPRTLAGYGITDAALKSDIEYVFRESLGDGANLNDYVNTGFYQCRTNARAQTGKNYPVTEAGFLDVHRCDDISYQTYRTYNGGAVFTRTKYVNSYSLWRRLSYTDEIDARFSNAGLAGPAATVPAGSNLQNVRQNGIYHVIASQTINTPNNRSGILTCYFSSANYGYQNYRTWEGEVFEQALVGGEWQPWRVVGSVPVGAILYFDGDIPPNGWLILNGALLRVADYTALFRQIGRRYCYANDPEGTFRLADARGEFVRSLDLGRGIDSGRALGSPQESTLIGDRIGHLENGTAFPLKNTDPAAAPVNDWHKLRAAVESWPGAGTLLYRIRPRNIAFSAIIKY